MVVYTCDYCNYTTSIKTHFNRHNSTKKHIKNIASIDHVTQKSIKKVYSDEKGIYNTTKKYNVNKHHKGIKKQMLTNNSNTIVTQSNTKKYVCHFCEKDFTHSNSYYRHIKHYCKMKDNTNSAISFNEYKEQQELLIKVLLDSKNEIVASKNELIAEKDKNTKDKEKLYQELNNTKSYQYNDSRQIKTVLIL